MISGKYFAVLHWVIGPEHRFQTGINYNSSLPTLYTSFCLKTTKTKPTKTAIS